MAFACGPCGRINRKNIGPTCFLAGFFFLFFPSVSFRGRTFRVGKRSDDDFFPRIRFGHGRNGSLTKFKPNLPGPHEKFVSDFVSAGCPPARNKKISSRERQKLAAHFPGQHVRPPVVDFRSNVKIFFCVFPVGVPNVDDFLKEKTIIIIISK